MDLGVCTLSIPLAQGYLDWKQRRQQHQVCCGLGSLGSLGAPRVLACPSRVDSQSIMPLEIVSVRDVKQVKTKELENEHDSSLPLIVHFRHVPVVRCWSSSRVATQCRTGAIVVGVNWTNCHVIGLGWTGHVPTQDSTIVHLAELDLYWHSELAAHLSPSQWDSKDTRGASSPSESGPHRDAVLVTRNVRYYSHTASECNHLTFAGLLHVPIVASILQISPSDFSTRYSVWCISSAM